MKEGWQEALIDFFIYNMTTLLFNQILFEIVKRILTIDICLQEYISSVQN